ncbi:helix-turn-helix domain-containing protein [Petrimonas sulfuriphila]|uniref:helix-turn-helix domain-containing protein n=1 Tax=Petrimonas sulfuriphila TaxID=285070 RepID=UPI003EB85CA0
MHNNEIIKEYNTIFGFDINSKSQSERTTFARYAVFLYLRNDGWRLTEIGRLFGKHHATVVNGINQMLDKLSVNDKLAVGYWDKLTSYYAKRAVERFRCIKNQTINN